MTPPGTHHLPTQIPSMMATLACYEGMFGPYHVQTLALTTTLAVALCQAGRVREGRPLLERALADLAKHHNPNHPLRARALEAWFEFADCSPAIS